MSISWAGGVAAAPRSAGRHLGAIQDCILILLSNHPTLAPRPPHAFLLSPSNTTNSSGPPEVFRTDDDQNEQAETSFFSIPSLPSLPPISTPPPLPTVLMPGGTSTFGHGAPIPPPPSPTPRSPSAFSASRSESGAGQVRDYFSLGCQNSTGGLLDAKSGWWSYHSSSLCLYLTPQLRCDTDQNHYRYNPPHAQTTSPPHPSGSPFHPPAPPSFCGGGVCQPPLSPNAGFGPLWNVGRRAWGSQQSRRCDSRGGRALWAFGGGPCLEGSSYFGEKGSF